MSDILEDNDIRDMEDVHFIDNGSILGHRAAGGLIVRKLTSLRSWI